MERASDKAVNVLTASEEAVLDHLLRGEANKEIAEELGCAVRTVEFHVSNILRKRGVSSRARLLAEAAPRLHSVSGPGVKRALAHEGQDADGEQEAVGDGLARARHSTSPKSL